MADYGDHSGLCSQEGAPLFPAEEDINNNTMMSSRDVFQVLFAKLDAMEKKSEERSRLQDARLDEMSKELYSRNTVSDEDAISTMASETEFLVDKEVVISQETMNRPAGDRTSVLGRLLPNSTGLSDSSRDHNPGTSLGPESTPAVGQAAENNPATAPVASQPPHTKLDLTSTIVQQYAEEKQPKPKEALGAKLHPDLEKQIKVCWTEDASQDEIVEAITPKFPTPDGLETTIRSQALNPVFETKNKQGRERLHWYYTRNQKRLQDIQDVGTRVTNIFASIADKISSADRDNVVVSSEAILKAALSGITLMGRMNRMLVDRRKYCVYSGCKTPQVEKLCSKDLIQNELLFGDNIKELIVEAKEESDLANSLFNAPKADHGYKRKSSDKSQEERERPSYNGYKTSSSSSKNSYGNNPKDRDRKNSGPHKKQKKAWTPSSSNQVQKRSGGRKG